MERKYARRYLRIAPDTPMYADMSIVQVGKRLVRSGTAHVRLADISPGGLRFISSLDLPADASVLLELTFRVLMQEFKLRGHVAYRVITGVSRYEYGFCFHEPDDTLRTCLKELFNNMTVRMRRQIVILRFNKPVE